MFIPTTRTIDTHHCVPGNLYFLHYIEIAIHVYCKAVAEQHTTVNKMYSFTISFPTFVSPQSRYGGLIVPTIVYQVFFFALY